METFAQIEGVYYPILAPNVPNNGHVFAFPDDSGFTRDLFVCYVDDSSDADSFTY